ncbi:MAG: hypothetical protein ABL888_04920 [Pirellulaceae bacterium]
MICSQLAQLIEARSPTSGPLDVARMTSLLLSCSQDTDLLANPEQFEIAWSAINMRLQAAIDQHEAMTGELIGLANSDPSKFTADQTWVLIRAIKVQSQLIKMYVGAAVVAVQ